MNESLFLPEKRSEKRFRWIQFLLRLSHQLHRFLFIVCHVYGLNNTISQEKRLNFSTILQFIDKMSSAILCAKIRRCQSSIGLGLPLPLTRLKWMVVFLPYFTRLRGKKIDLINRLQKKELNSVVFFLSCSIRFGSWPQKCHRIKH